jgi:hypothetical protein
MCGDKEVMEKDKVALCILHIMLKKVHSGVTY